MLDLLALPALPALTPPQTKEDGRELTLWNQMHAQERNKSSRNAMGRGGGADTQLCIFLFVIIATVVAEHM